MRCGPYPIEGIDKMKSGNRSNILLVEILIVVMFFMLAATFLMRMFSAARMQGEEADIANLALVRAQNVAERLYAAADPDEVLTEIGFEQTEGLWRSQEDGLLLEVEMKEEAAPAGVLKKQSVTVYSKEEPIVVLPVAKYSEEAGS